jgi:hypothetical protein
VNRSSSKQQQEAAAGSSKEQQKSNVLDTADSDSMVAMDCATVDPGGELTG